MPSYSFKFKNSILISAISCLSIIGTSCQDQNPATATETTVESQTQTQSQTQPQTDTFSETDTESQTQSETDTTSETDTASQTQSETDTSSETDTTSQTQSETDTSSETDTASQTQSETDTTSETDTASQTQSETDTSSETETASQTNTFTDTQSTTDTDTQTTIIEPTSISAGNDQTALEQDSIYLIGSVSNAQNEPLTYQWTQLSGPDITLQNPQSLQASFSVEEIETTIDFTFSFQVIDSQNQSYEDSVTITITPVNDAPIVSIIENSTEYNEDENIILTGTFSDIDSSLLTHQWLQISGTTAVLSNSNTSELTIHIDQLSQSETLEFSYEVTDNDNASSIAYTSIIINPVNDDPVSQIQMDQSLQYANSEIFLTATYSDEDSTIFSHQWSQVSSIDVTLENEDTAELTVIVSEIDTPQYLTFQYTITDDLGASHQSEISFTVYPEIIYPTVNAGEDQVIDAEQTVTLSASITDSDQTIVSQLWTQTSGTPVILSEPESLITTFDTGTFETEDTLVFQISITDDESNIYTDEVSVILNITNEDPIINEIKTQFSYPNEPITITAEVVDPDGGNVSFEWRQVGGPDVSNLNQIDNYSVEFNTPEVTEETIFIFLYIININEPNSMTQVAYVWVFPEDTSTPIDVKEIKLNDTGLNTCYEELDCLAADTVKQDAHYGRDSQISLQKIGSGVYGFDFSKIDSQGNILDSEATEFSCVLDNHTGLMWEVKTNDNGLHHFEDTYVYYQPDTDLNQGIEGTAYSSETCEGWQSGVLETQCTSLLFMQNVNNENLCGFNDWQLPTYEELHSIVIYESGNRTIDSHFFPNTKPDSFYRTITADYSFTGFHWLIKFGSTNSHQYSDDTGSLHPIRLVRTHH